MMTDREWYAKLSTIVLEGIELVNKNASHSRVYENQYNIRAFVLNNMIPDRKKKEALRSTKRCIANIVMWGGFAAAAIVLFFDLIMWADIFLGSSENVLGALGFLIVAVILCGIGVIGEYFDALL